MAKTLKILGVHGLGDHRSGEWMKEWEDAVLHVFPKRDDVALDFEFATYDDIFEEVDISAIEAVTAVYKLSRSAITSPFRRRRGVVGHISELVRWTAGYVVAWVEDDGFKRRSRKRILDALREHEPDILLAHSLGSLVTYNALTHRDATEERVARVIRSLRYVTLGSQIGNDFVVRNLTPGRIVSPDVERWYHLYNHHDNVFTAPIRIHDAENFLQVETVFDDPGFSNLSAPSYLSDEATLAEVWQPIVAETVAPGVRGMKERPARKRPPRAPRPTTRLRQRALLVGINAYPNAEDRLEGCLNDVFLMSSVLQEGGFAAESIRVCLDDRATAEGILERLEWLLDDPQPGDERVFYYSGHGAQVPEYGVQGEPDRLTETLVPYDFDWSPDTYVSDERIHRLYAQLPYNIRFTMVFDCCHSGGIHRDGARKIRGINPPDDIRHRELRWDPDEQMWVERKFDKLNSRFSSRRDVNETFFGKNGSTVRLGRASTIRGQTEREYRVEKERRKDTPFGPYLPLVLEACAENQAALEYRHGVASYGAFTYSLALNLRKYKTLSFDRLVRVATSQLERLGYDQKPQILGPTRIRRGRVRWTAA